MSATTLFTFDEFDSWVATRDERWELVDGEPVMVPSEAFANLDATSTLLLLLGRHLPPADWALLQAADLVIRRADPAVVRQPDLMLVRRPGHRDGRVEPSGVALVVETLSPSTARTDTGRKIADYAEAGVPRYLLLDVRGPAPLIRLITNGADTDWTDRVTLTIDDHVIDVAAADLTWD